MEKTASPPPEKKSISPVSPQSPLLPSSPPCDRRTQQFASDFTNMYHSIFPPKPSPLPASFSLTPSTSSPSSAATTDEISTEHRLQQARLILEYQELCDHYELSLARLQTLTKELEQLRMENSDLRLANIELVRLLSLSSQAALQSGLLNISDVAAPSAFAPKHAIEHQPNKSERRNSLDRVSLPKSISIRTADYLKAKQTGASNGPSSTSTQPRVTTQLNTAPAKQRVYVATAGGKRHEDLGALELEAYNQGMWKTELCNKWQETGACPYGENCQFAHGITELRPVIRHPRYKTQVCRMVLTGDVCPYGHRCHFRHSLTEQERLVGPR